MDRYEKGSPTTPRKTNIEPEHQIPLKKDIHFGGFLGFQAFSGEP